jgi:hypothetical protein
MIMAARCITNQIQQSLYFHLIVNIILIQVCDAFVNSYFSDTIDSGQSEKAMLNADRQVVAAANRGEGRKWGALDGNSVLITHRSLNVNSVALKQLRTVSDKSSGVVLSKSHRVPFGWCVERAESSTIPSTSSKHSDPG